MGLVRFQWGLPKSVYDIPLNRDRNKWFNQQFCILYKQNGIITILLHYIYYSIKYGGDDMFTGQKHKERFLNEIGTLKQSNSYFNRKIGGLTGDTLGAANELCALAMYALAALRFVAWWGDRRYAKWKAGANQARRIC